MLKTMGNPEAMMKSALENNPDLKNIIEESDGDYEKAFYKCAEKMGINPNEVLDLLR